MQRQEIDLSHGGWFGGKVGAVQTADMVNVSMGDSIESTMKFNIRCAPLRSPILLGMKIDCITFYVPHRHVYGEAWMNLIRQGVDASTVLPARNLAAKWWCLGDASLGPGNVPAFYVDPFVQIWNEFYRDPSRPEISLSDIYGLTWSSSSSREHVDLFKFGFPACHIPNIWTSPPKANTSSADHQVAIQGNQLELYDLRRTKARNETEIERQFENIRYRDIVQAAVGEMPNIDTEQRPEVLAHTEAAFDGEDIEGTSEATLGKAVGRMDTQVTHHVPRKFFIEGGSVWTLLLLRFPPIYFDERTMMSKFTSPTYKQISGDPAILASEGPVSLRKRDVFTGNDNTVLGQVPYGQWHRYQPNRTADYLKNIEGAPFVDSQPPDLPNSPLFSGESGIDMTPYINPNQYDAVFKSPHKYGHFIVNSAIAMRKLTSTPAVEASLYAGANA